MNPYWNGERLRVKATVRQLKDKAGVSQGGALVT
jgi:hypothetical protein